MPSTTVGHPPLLTSAETCKILGIHASTLTRWVKTGKIAYAKKIDGLRGAMVFDRTQVEALATERDAA